VGIWTSGGTLLGSTTVSAGAPDGTGFRYATTTPISLFAGQQYFIGGTETQANGDRYVRDVSDLVMGPSITFLGTARNSGSGFTFPNVVGTTMNGRFGPNFQYTVQSGAVPEPAAWALMIGGFGLAGAALRRRRAVASSLAR
ncbi:MAG: PEPxxWA-CTERM sorting domain-containing protein, partial [Alphaproteobacteria bacterium]